MSAIDDRRSTPVDDELDLWPLGGAEAKAALEALARGEAWKPVFESALVALSPERADHLMQLSREARGAWFVLLDAMPTRVLHVGNALSGAALPLAKAGARVVLVDVSRTRLELASARARAWLGVEVETVCVDARATLPWPDGHFDLVISEGELAMARFRGEIDPRELLRVCGGDWYFSANNRLGYKRSGGRHGDFRVPGPIEYARRALSPRPEERTLIGHRAWLERVGAQRVQAFALYPHQADFKHVVRLGGGSPELFVGPKERRNRVKLLGRAVGLFPWLTPSFAFLARRESGPTPAPRLDAWIARIADDLSEPRPVVEHLLPTRGNTALVTTRVPGADASDPKGRYVLHIPLSAQKQRQLARHHPHLHELRARFPELGVPEPLFQGRFDGVELACERRLPGLTAPQLTGDVSASTRMLTDAARDLAGLVTRDARPFDAADFERLIERRFDCVAKHAVVPATIANLARMRDAAREALVGECFPLVFHHADLRAKHVQVRTDGSVIGYLDWGSSEPVDLPYFDLLHLLAHERKNEAGLSAAQAWALVRDRRGLRPAECAALESYCASIGLSDRARAALEAIYPVLVAAMAEFNWDYSRPRWLATQFRV